MPDGATAGDRTVMISESAARRIDGIPSFSLAIDPSYPVGYREGAQPPAPDSEWRPERFSWSDHASAYDYVLVRSEASPAELFGAHLAELELVSEVARWKVFRVRR